MTGEDEYAWKRKNNILVYEILDPFHPILRFLSYKHIRLRSSANTEIIYIYCDGATGLV
jgi:hypothetical protein